MSIDKYLLEILNTQNACSVCFQSEGFMLYLIKYCWEVQVLRAYYLHCDNRQG